MSVRDGSENRTNAEVLHYFSSLLRDSGLAYSDRPLKTNDTGESAVPDDHAQPTPAAVRAIEESCQPIAGSEKIYITGSRPDIRVPMRQIRQSATPLANGEFEQNPPIAVYDTSGPYTDRSVQIDVRKGSRRCAMAGLPSAATARNWPACRANSVVAANRIR